MQVPSHKCETSPCTLVLLCPALALSTEGPSSAEGCFSLLRGATKEHCWSPGLASLAAHGLEQRGESGSGLWPTQSLQGSQAISPGLSFSSVK